MGRSQSGMKVQIVGVSSRSTQGITRPFLCKGENGLTYFVKGSGAGRRALICEWVAGRIGQDFGLPVPPFVQASVNSDLIRFSAREDINDLGEGTGFGSQIIENVDELPYLYIDQVAPELRAKVLLFDWWICNGDRTLTEEGGNVNLLWTHRDQRLHVIDHNLAFDEQTMTGFWDQHVFRDSARDWNDEFKIRMTSLMRRVAARIPDYWREMPAEWTEVDSGITLPHIKRVLSRFETNPERLWIS
jgi:hypothetical protein